MTTLIIFIHGLFAFCATIVIDACRIVKSLEQRGEEFPRDRLEQMKLWARYWNDEL